jgi:hypothetical protein
VLRHSISLQGGREKLRSWDARGPQGGPRNRENRRPSVGVGASGLITSVRPREAGGGGGGGGERAAGEQEREACAGGEPHGGGG